MSIQCYEKVKIVNSKKFPRYNGKFGYVLGISEEDGEVQGYAIDLVDDNKGIWLYVDEVIGTGEVASKEMFYDGTSITVQVQGSKGTLKTD